MDGAAAGSLIAELRSILLTRLTPLVERRPFALLDFPQHSNVGDSAIWLGELELMQQLTDARPAYVASFNDCDWDKLAAFDGQIFLHGGGNFGDLWPWHHNFREEVLRRCKGRRIIQLPQTLHFNHPQNLLRAKAAIAQHGDFIVLARDQRSLEIARALDCEVILAPDSAFMLDLERTGVARHDVVFLRRTDKEAEALPPAASGWVELDWLGEPPRLWADMKRRALSRGLRDGRWSRDAMREIAYREIARARVSRGIRMLSRGRAVVTDRLHAHILATMLGIPNYVVDNKYGKIGGFVATWRTDRPGSLAHTIVDFQAFLAENAAA